MSLAKTVVLLIVLAIAVSGQVAFTATAQNNNSELVAARAVAVQVPPDTPSFAGGGLVTEREANGQGRRVWLTVSQPGAYIVRGAECNGGERSLGDLYIDPQQTQQTVTMIYDSLFAGASTPGAPQLCGIDVVRVGGGRIERALVDVTSWQSNNSTTASVTGESVSAKDGRYRIMTGALPADAVVILGRSALGKGESTLLGVTTVVFPANVYLPPAGPTTLTVCLKGGCRGVVYERRLEVQGTTAPQ